MSTTDLMYVYYVMRGENWRQRKTTNQSILLNSLNIKAIVVSCFLQTLNQTIVEEVKVKIVYDGYSSYLWIWGEKREDLLDVSKWLTGWTLDTCQSNRGSERSILTCCTGETEIMCTSSERAATMSWVQSSVAALHLFSDQSPEGSDSLLLREVFVRRSNTVWMEMQHPADSNNLQHLQAGLCWWSECTVYQTHSHWNDLEHQTDELLRSRSGV